ncbi:MAG: hypothetical protein K6F72_00170 [Bacteroidales bacterium]|nr:hypothetical protein [Bacteroidales bacterium]
MCKNGTTEVDFLSLIPGGAAANANYLLNLTHWTCGNRKLCANGLHPITANLAYQVMGTPVSLGNGSYCCEVAVTGTVTYMPYRCGDNNRCGCNQCPVTDNIFTTLCVPCSSAAVPTITGGDVVAVPTDLRDCCAVTNAVSLTTSINVTTA